MGVPLPYLAPVYHCASEQDRRLDIRSNGGCCDVDQSLWYFYRSFFPQRTNQPEIYKHSISRQENQEVRVSSESNQDYWQGLCDVDQSVSSSFPPHLSTQATTKSFRWHQSFYTSIFICKSQMTNIILKICQELESYHAIVNLYWKLNTLKHNVIHIQGNHTLYYCSKRLNTTKISIPGYIWKSLV